MYPPPPDPQPTFVAILDLLGYKNHLCDGSGDQRPGGLSQLYETYFLLLHALKDSTTFDYLELSDDGRLSAIDEKIERMVASDTIMLWASESKVRFLVASVSRLMIMALSRGAPLRGSLAFGDCIFDLEKGILIGYPIVEAVAAENAQDWIGVGVLPNAAVALKDQRGVVQYDVPMKSNSMTDRGISLSHAIAWHWAEETPNAAEIYLTRLCGVAPPKTQLKYEKALSFVRAVHLAE